jgi:RHS repeat-associated protein
VFLKGSQSALWSRSYKYSGEGDLLSVEDNRRGTAQYEYDAAHRISIAQIQRGTLSRQSKYLFDSAGNLLQQPGLSEVTLLEGNRVLTANGDRFEYNNRNHISLREGRTGTTKYFYDSRDMLVGCETPDGVWSASYDPLGRRIRKTFNERKSEFFWDSDRLIAELNDDGRLRIYVYADAVALAPLLFLDYDSPESDPATGRVYSVFADHLGSPLRVEDSRGDLVWEAEYDPYGTAYIDSRSTIEFNLRYPGHYYDPELGLHYNRFRYYSPELGRYLQSDPVGLPGGENLYAYSANPLVTVDLRGTCPGGPVDGTSDTETAEDGSDGEETEPSSQGGGSSDDEEPAGVQPYEVGTYKELRDRSVVRDGLDLDHQPSNASNIARAEAELGRPLTDQEKATVRDNGTAVAVPQDWHRSSSPTYGGRNNQTQIQGDAANPSAAAQRDSQAMVNGASPQNQAAAQTAADQVRQRASTL